MGKTRAPRATVNLVTGWLSCLPAFGFDQDESAGRFAPSEFRLFRAGINQTDKGDFLFDDEAAASVMAAYAEKGVPLMADYEHQALVQPPIEAPASATSFVPQVRNGELWATEVQWTDRARAYLEAGEYRMFSPAFTHDQKSGRILRLINFALTNNPATHQLEPLVAATNDPQGDKTMPETCSACTTLTAQLKEAQEKCAALTVRLSAFEKDDADKLSAVALRGEIVALTGKTTSPEIVGTVAALKDAHGKLEKLSAEIAAHKEASAKADFTATLTKAIDVDKKIAPAQRAYWEGQITVLGIEKASQMLKGFVETAVALVATNPATPSGGAYQPTAQLSTMHKAMGVDTKAFAEWQNKQQSQRA